jgi:hypothetical protein
MGAYRAWSNRPHQLAVDEDNLTEKLLIELEIAHDRFQRREAIAWLVLSYESEALAAGHTDAIVGNHGPFISPEEALIQKTKHDDASLEGFVNVIVPLYPPVQWKDER